MFIPMYPISWVSILLSKNIKFTSLSQTGVANLCWLSVMQLLESRKTLYVGMARMCTEMRTRKGALKIFQTHKL